LGIRAGTALGHGFHAEARRRGGLLSGVELLAQGHIISIHDFRTSNGWRRELSAALRASASKPTLRERRPEEVQIP